MCVDGVGDSVECAECAWDVVRENRINKRKYLRPRITVEKFSDDVVSDRDVVLFEGCDVVERVDDIVSEVEIAISSVALAFGTFVVREDFDNRGGGCVGVRFPIGSVPAEVAFSDGCVVGEPRLEFFFFAAERIEYEKIRLCELRCEFFEDHLESDIVLFFLAGALFFSAGKYE